MWRYLAILGLAGCCLALPAAQNTNANGQSLDDLISNVFGTTPQPSAPKPLPTMPPLPEANGSDLDSLINNVFGTGPNTTEANRNGAGGGTILGTQNKPTPPADNCECVPYYQCRDGTILENGYGLIDIRSGFGVIDIANGETSFGPCENYLDVCCKPPDRVKAGEEIKPNIGPRTGCGKRNTEGVGFRITGQTDNEAQFGEFPWMVAILKEETIGEEKLNVYQCGGALIHRQAVLTAAHCVNGKRPNELRVRAGEWDTQTKNEIYPHQDRNVQNVIVHEKFHSGALYNDFAILILAEPVDYAENVDIVCLPDRNAVFDGSRCFASGWGKDIFGKEGHYQVILKRVELPVVPHSTCQNALRQTRLGKYFTLDKSFICAGGEPGKDTCKGDGGSPLVCPLRENPKRYVQAGIVAWGIGCGENQTPGVYANVANVRDWIDETMAYYNLDNSVYQYSAQIN